MYEKRCSRSDDLKQQFKMLIMLMSTTFPGIYGRSLEMSSNDPFRRTWDKRAVAVPISVVEVSVTLLRCVTSGVTRTHPVPITYT